MSVLRARQKEGFLPECGIANDVRGYKPSGAALEAEVLTGGFPCQANSSESGNVYLTCFLMCFYSLETALFQNLLMLFPCSSSVCKLIARFLANRGQGVSAAGRQQGLKDGRSSLIRELFRVYDVMPRASGP